MDRVVLGSAATATQPRGVGESISVLISDLRGSLAARVEIARIEARQSLSLVLRSTGSTCAAVLLLLTAWWTVCAAFVLLAVDAGAPRLGALLAVAAGNIALALWAALYARKQAAAIGMPHTRRLLLDPGEGLNDPPAEQLDVTHR